MKYLSLIAIFSFVCFTGCGISDDARTPSNDESATYYLCKYWWHAEYVDVHNTRYIQELDFHKDGTGVEIIGKHQQANGNSTRRNIISNGTGEVLIKQFLSNMMKAMLYSWIMCL